MELFYLIVNGIIQESMNQINQKIILWQVTLFLSLLMVLHQHLVVEITLSVYGMSKQGNKKPDWMVILVLSGCKDNSICLWNVKTGQQKAKLDGHTNDVNSVGFSLDGNTLATSSEDNSIRLWDVKIRQDNPYNNILEQFNNPLFFNNFLPVTTNITILLISQTHILQAKGAVEIQGEFKNYQGVGLQSLLKSKGSYIFGSFMQQ